MNVMYLPLNEHTLELAQWAWLSSGFARDASSGDEGSYISHDVTE